MLKPHKKDPNRKAQMKRYNEALKHPYEDLGFGRKDMPKPDDWKKSGGLTSSKDPKEIARIEVMELTNKYGITREQSKQVHVYMKTTGESNFEKAINDLKAMPYANF